MPVAKKSVAALPEVVRRMVEKNETTDTKICHLKNRQIDISYRLRINPARKHAELFILPDGSLEVRVPPHTKKEDIEEFIAEQADWILQIKEKKEREAEQKKTEKPSIPYDPTLPYNILFGLDGEPIRYQIHVDTRRMKMKIKCKDGMVYAYVSPGYHLPELGNFIIANTSWIRTTMKNIHAYPDNHETDTIHLSDGQEVSYWIFRTTLLDTYRLITSDAGTILVYVPRWSDISDIRKFVTEELSAKIFGTVPDQSVVTKPGDEIRSELKDPSQKDGVSLCKQYTVTRVKNRTWTSFILFPTGKLEVRVPLAYNRKMVKKRLWEQKTWIQDTKERLTELIRNNPHIQHHSSVPYQILCSSDDHSFIYQIQVSTRKKTYSLQITPDKELIIQAPVQYNIETIEEFIFSKKGWIEKKQEYFESVPVVQKRQYQKGEEFYYLGKRYLLDVREGFRNAGVTLEEDSIVVTILPDIYSSSHSEYVRRLVTEWYQKQAFIIVPDLVKGYSSMIQKPAPKIRFNTVRRKWGSYSPGKHEIMINIALMMAPLSLVDYVAAHEVCHIVYHNHSLKFWELVGQIMPDYQNRRKELKKWQYAYHL